MVILLASLLALLPASLLAGHAAALPHRAPPPVSIAVAGGYDKQFRTEAWTPVRVTLRNRTVATISGTVSVTDSGNATNNQGPPLPYHAQYETPAVLPAGATKRVTLYIPGSDIGGEVDARFAPAGGSAVSASDYLTAFGDSSMSVGTLSTDPLSTAWLNRINQSTTLTVVRLSTATIDPVPDVLTNFDAIVLSNVDASQLDRDQLAALGKYVIRGGALILIGGPDWQETLHPLGSLVPGHLAGTATLPDLHGLASFTGSDGSGPGGPSTVSVLTGPRGTVLASERGVPLIVRERYGAGTVEYLAFDPGLSPITHWSHAGAVLQHLITTAAPLAANRAAQPANGPPGPFGLLPYGAAGNIAGELANLPAAALPSLMLFVILCLLYVLIIGPVNFLVLRRLHRLELMWATVPALSLLCVGSTFGLAFHLKGSSVELNTVSVVSLVGDGQDPASVYVGLFAPVRGDYRLTYRGAGLVSALPQSNGYSSGPQGDPLGLRLQEGGQTGATFVSMNMWSMRNLAIHTWVSLPGSIQTHLSLDAHGNVVGTVHNGLPFPVLRPAVLADRGIAHLPDIPSGGTVDVRLKPAADVFNGDNSTPINTRLYGTPRYPGWYNYGGYYGSGPASIGVANFGCCQGPIPDEKTLLDRIRNVAAMLPEAQLLPSQGEVMFVGWTTQPLGSLQVDGSEPHQRNITMLEMPLSVGFPRTGFRLRAGTIGARLVDTIPAQPSNSGSCCCACPQPIYIGSGGSGTFEFDLPDGHARFSRLTLWANAGGAAGSSIGRVYDWQSRRWVHVDLSSGQAALSRPNRFVSPWGAVLVRLDADNSSGDITIKNIDNDLQLTGQAVQG